MRRWGLLALGGLLIAAAAPARASDTRFSRTLSSGEWTATGLAKLSSDQLAVLDALIRRDERIYAVPDVAHPAPARFSLRLSPAERSSAGLGFLADAELARLDTAVDCCESNDSRARVPGAASRVWQPEGKGPSPEIHGLISFTYGTGRGGNSMMGGAMAVSVDDPAHGLSLLLGYGESRGKAPYPGGACGRGYGTGCFFDPWAPFVP